jgi:hypothetical protein
VPEFRKLLYSFASDKGGWLAETDGADPLDWWNVHKSEHPSLYELSVTVLSIPTSSAASERAWSIFDLIHTKKRNRLSTGKVSKLAFVYINGASVYNTKIDMAMIQSFPDSMEDYKARERERQPPLLPLLEQRGVEQARSPLLRACSLAPGCWLVHQSA